MPRIRSIKPEIWLSPQVMNLSRDARVLFVGLITQADDDGRGSADPRRIKATIFPGDDDATVAQIDAWLAEVVVQELATLYDAGTQGRLYALASWAEHQKISHPARSKYPGPNGSTKPHRKAPERSRKAPEHSGKTPERSAKAPEVSGKAPEYSVNAPKSAPLIGSDRIGSDRKGSFIDPPVTTSHARARPVLEAGPRAIGETLEALFLPRRGEA